jgi:hypothetical protein
MDAVQLLTALASQAGDRGGRAAPADHTSNPQG